MRSIENLEYFDNKTFQIVWHKRSTWKQYGGIICLRNNDQNSYLFITYYDLKDILKANRIILTNATLDEKTDRIRRDKTKLQEIQLDKLEQQYGCYKNTYKKLSIDDVVLPQSNGRYTVLYMDDNQRLIVMDNLKEKLFACYSYKWCWLFNEDSFTNALLFRGENLGIILPSKDVDYINQSNGILDAEPVRQIMQSLDLLLKQQLDLGKTVAMCKDAGFNNRIDIRIVDGNKSDNEKVQGVVDRLNDIFCGNIGIDISKLNSLMQSKIKVSEHWINSRYNTELEGLETYRFLENSGNITNVERLARFNNGFLQASLDNVEDLGKFMSDHLDQCYTIYILHPNRDKIQNFDLRDSIEKHREKQCTKSYGNLYSNTYSIFIKNVYRYIAIQHSVQAIYDVNNTLYNRANNFIVKIYVDSNSRKCLDICNMNVLYIDDDCYKVTSKIGLDELQILQKDGNFGNCMLMQKDTEMHTYDMQQIRGCRQIDLADLRNCLGLSRLSENKVGNDLRNLDLNIIISSSFMKLLFGNLNKDDTEIMRQVLKSDLNEAADILDNYTQ